MQLYDYQEEAIQAVIEFLNTKKGHPLVAAPMGSGKSVMIAFLIKHIMETYPGIRILMVVHKKELIEQNLGVLKTIWPNAPVGVHSASIGQKSVLQPIIFGQIQSMYKKAMNFGYRNVMLIDEAHAVPHKSEGIYRQLVDEQLVINPEMRVVGFTGTPYRLKGGMLTDDSYGQPLFTEICYRILIKTLLEKGKLCNIVTVPPILSYDDSNLKMGSKGEFTQKSLDQEINSQVSVTEAAVDQIIQEGRTRKKWITFTTNVKQAIIVNDLFKSKGIKSAIVTGDTGKSERERIVREYKAGQYQNIVNCNLYTTGFNVDDIDLVALLRMTASAGLYEQMVGRAMRVFLGKIDALVLDFGGNIKRHGPIDNIKVKKRAKKQTQKKSMPLKQCPSCLNMIPIQNNECPECNFIFPQKPRHTENASSEVILTCNRRFMVKEVQYRCHAAMSGKYRLLVRYVCHGERKRVFNEFICIGDKGKSGEWAMRWFKQRCGCDQWLKMLVLSFDQSGCGVDITRSYINGLIATIQRIQPLLEPITITVDDLNKQYPKIINYEFAEIW